MSKYIALIDCDSFFCSCERKLNPELNCKPLCVVSSERGCVIARSKEAKAMGIKMGDPLKNTRIVFIWSQTTTIIYLFQNK